MHQKTKEYDRQKVRFALFLVKSCLEVQARGCRRKDKACPFPVPAPPCGACSNAPQVNNACSTFHRVCYPWGVKFERVTLKCNKMQRVQLVGDDDEASVLDHLTEKTVLHLSEVRVIKAMQGARRAAVLCPEQCQMQ